MSIRRMEGRDINERHRTSTTLELLFDLIIVVAVAQAAGGLHHMLAEGMYATGAVRYMMAFWCVVLPRPKRPCLRPATSRAAPRAP